MALTISRQFATVLWQVCFRNTVAAQMAKAPAHHPIARNVGFSLNGGFSATPRSCLFCAMNGSRRFYSITSLALTSNV